MCTSTFRSICIILDEWNTFLDWNAKSFFIFVTFQILWKMQIWWWSKVCGPQLLQPVLPASIWRKEGCSPWLVLNQPSRELLVSKHMPVDILFPRSLVLVSPNVVFSTCPTGMMGYGLAKAAVHQFVASLAAPKSGLPDGAMVAAILP